LLNCGSNLQLQDLHLVTWSNGPTTSAAIIKHGHSEPGAEMPPERNLTMLACGTSGMSVHKIEDALQHMLNALQRRLGSFAEAFSEMQQSMGDGHFIYQPQQAIPRPGQVMPVVYVSTGETCQIIPDSLTLFFRRRASISRICSLSTGSSSRGENFHHVFSSSS